MSILIKVTGQGDICSMRTICIITDCKIANKFAVPIGLLRTRLLRHGCYFVDVSDKDKQLDFIIAISVDEEWLYRQWLLLDRSSETKFMALLLGGTLKEPVTVLDYYVFSNFNHLISTVLK